VGDEREADGPYEVSMGLHTTRFEPPDLYVVTRVGSISRDEMAISVAAINRFSQGKTWIFGIIDLSRSTVIAMAAKKPWLQLPKNIRARAYIINSPRQQVVFSAMNASNPANRDLARDYFYSEAEARAWIDAHRRAAKAAAGARPAGSSR
jgi:hypothetical protein